MTPRQKEVLDFIKDYWAKNGYAPTYEAICLGLGIRSKGNVHEIIHALQERGFITFIPRRARSIRVVKEKVPKAAPVA